MDTGYPSRAQNWSWNWSWSATAPALAAAEGKPCQATGYSS